MHLRPGRYRLDIYWLAVDKPDEWLMSHTEMRDISFTHLCRQEPYRLQGDSGARRQRRRTHRMETTHGEYGKFRPMGDWRNKISLVDAGMKELAQTG
jgi:hypothetical protein